MPISWQPRHCEFIEHGIDLALAPLERAVQRIAQGAITSLYSNGDGESEGQPGELLRRSGRRYCEMVRVSEEAGGRSPHHGGIELAARNGLHDALRRRLLAVDEVA